VEFELDAGGEYGGRGGAVGYAWECFGYVLCSHPEGTCTGCVENARHDETLSIHSVLRRLWMSFRETLLEDLTSSTHLRA
jgi:hypothetical protein